MSVAAGFLVVAIVALAWATIVLVREHRREVEGLKMQVDLLQQAKDLPVLRNVALSIVFAHGGRLPALELAAVWSAINMLRLAGEDVTELLERVPIQPREIEQP